LARNQPWLADVYAASVCVATGANPGRRVAVGGDRVDPEAIDSRTSPDAPACWYSKVKQSRLAALFQKIHLRRVCDGKQRGIAN
jgi:hypothetical protein